MRTLQWYNDYPFSAIRPEKKGLSVFLAVNAVNLQILTALQVSN